MMEAFFGAGLRPRVRHERAAVPAKHVERIKAAAVAKRARKNRKRLVEHAYDVARLVARRGLDLNAFIALSFAERVAYGSGQ